MAVSVNETEKNWGAIFQKKRKAVFKKAESEKKKRNSAEKRKTDIPGICSGEYKSRHKS